MNDVKKITLEAQISGHYFRFPGHPRERLLIKLQHIRTFIIFAGNPASLFALYMVGFKDALGDELFFDLMGLLAAMQLSYAYVHRKLIIETFDLMIEHKERFPGQPDAEFRRSMSPVWKITRTYKTMAGLLIVCYFVLPRLYDLTIGAILGTPLWSHQLPLSMAGLVRIREVQERDLFYVGVTVTSVVWCTFSAYSRVGLDMLLIFSGFYYAAIAKGFEWQTQQGLDPDLTPAERIRLVKNFAAHYHSIRRISLNIKKIFGFPYALQNMFGAFVLMSLMYGVQAQDNKSMAANLTTYFNMGSLVGMLGATAYVGQKLSDQNSIIFNALYAFPWYELSPEGRKYFVPLLHSSRDPLKIEYVNNMFTLNHETLTSIVNTACSYLTFVVSML